MGGMFWILLLLSCYYPVNGRSGWTSGREYIYRWNAVTGSGIPGVGPEASGVYLSAQLVIQARDEANVLVKLSGLSARAVQGEVFSWNEVLESPSTHWKEIPLAGRAHVEMPFQIRLRNGQVELLSVSPNEPLWSTNLKKAIASNLQIPTGTASTQQMIPEDTSFDTLTEGGIASRFELQPDRQASQFLPEGQLFHQRSESGLRPDILAENPAASLRTQQGRMRAYEREQAQFGTEPIDTFEPESQTYRRIPEAQIRRGQRAEEISLGDLGSRQSRLRSFTREEMPYSSMQTGGLGSRRMMEEERLGVRSPNVGPLTNSAVFTIMENSVTGTCETSYQISPLSADMRMMDEDLPVGTNPEGCATGSYFQIIKSVDFNMCRSSPVFNVVSPPGWKCKPGAATCRTSRLRSSIGRYVACGTLDSFTIVSMVHHGALISNPYAIDTERLEAHTLQKLRLQTTRPLTETFPNIGSTVTLRSLNFAFAPEAPGAARMAAPHVHDVDRSLRTLTFAQIRSQINTLLQDTAHDIRTAEDLAARSAIDRVAAVSEALSLLDYIELGQLVSDVMGLPVPRPDSRRTAYNATAFEPELQPAMGQYGEPGRFTPYRQEELYERGGVAPEGPYESGSHYPRQPLPREDIYRRQPPYERVLKQSVEDISGHRDVPVSGRARPGFMNPTGGLPVNPIPVRSGFSASDLRRPFGREATEPALSGQSELFFDAFISSGSNPAVSLMIDLVSSRRISTDRAVQAISALPLVIRTPTQQILQQLIGMIRLEATQGDRDLFYSSLLSVSTLLRMACVNQTEARTRFPVTLYGPFCTPSDPVIISQFIPILSEVLRRDTSRMDKFVALTALGNLGHPAIMPVLIPLIEGQVDASINVRTKAVIALHKLAIAENQRAHQILMSVYQNPSEHYQVRIAAFTLLILSNPPVHRWQEFAISTWFERDMQVASYVYTTLKSLGAMKDPIPSMVEPSEKAYAVLSIARPIPWSFHYSRNIILSGRIHENRLGGTLFTEIFGSQETVLPRHVYSRLNWCLGALNMDSVEFELYGLHLPKVWDQISTLFTPVHGTATNRDVMRDVLHERGSARVDLEPLYAELRRIREHYETVSAPSEDMSEGFMHLVLMESVARFYPLDSRSIESLFRGMASTNQALTAGLPINFIKWMPLLEFETIIPDPLGFAITLRTKAHAMMSLQGAVAANIGPESQTYAIPTWGAANGFNVDIDVNPTIIAKVVSKVAINAGFTMVKAASGVDTHAMVSLPGRFSVRLDIPQMRFAAAWSNAATTTSLDKTIFHFHVRPFTGMQSVHDLTPVTSVQVSTEILGLGEGLHDNLSERDISGLGFGFRIIERSENPISLDNIWNIMGPQFNFITASTLMWMPSSVKRKLIKVVHRGVQDSNQIVLLFNMTTPYTAYGPRGVHNPSEPVLGQTVPRAYPHSVPPGSAVPAGPTVRPTVVTPGANQPIVPPVVPGTVVQPGGVVRPGTGPVSPSEIPQGPAQNVDPNAIGTTPSLYNLRNLGWLANATSGVNMELHIIGKEQAVFRFYAGKSSSQGGERQAFHLSFSKPAAGLTDASFEVCIDGESRLPSLQLSRRDFATAEASETIAFNASVGFGRTCSSAGFKVFGTAMQSPMLKAMIKDALMNQRCDVASGSWQRWNEQRYEESSDFATEPYAQPNQANPDLNPVPRGNRVLTQYQDPYNLENDHISSRPRSFYNPVRPESDFYPSMPETTRRERIPDFMDRPLGGLEPGYPRRPFRNPEYQGPPSRSYGGLPNTCRIAREWSNILDTYNITADLSTLPHFAVNATHMFGQYFNRYWLPYYSRSGGVPGRVHMVIKTHPLIPDEYGAADVAFYLPNANASFATGKLPSWMGMFLPVTKNPSFTGALFGDSFSPVCVLRDNTVTTFDGVTYEGELTDCNHVLISNTRAARSAEGPRDEQHFAVLAKQRGAKKVFTLLLGTNEIFIGPISATGPGVIRVNGVDMNFGANNTLQIPLTSHEGAIASDVAIADQLNDGSLRFAIPAQGFEMVTDGNAAQIRVSPMLRGQLAGMCGNMDSQPGTSELRGPDGCRLSSGRLFAASYAIMDGRCTGISDDLRSELRREQANCQRTDYYPSRVSHFSRRLPTEQQSGSCNELRTLTLYRGDRKCFSVQPVLDCKPGCEPRTQVSKNLGFHCVSGRLANKLEEEALTRPLTEISGRPETFRTTLNLPTSCVTVSNY